MKMKHALLALAILLTLPCAAMAQPRMTESVIGCRSSEDFKTWLTLLNQQDEVAANKFEAARTSSGACQQLVKHKAFHPMKTEIFNGYPLVCARIIGEAECYWTAQAFTSDRS